MKQRNIFPVILMLMTPIWAQAEGDWNFKLSPYLWFSGAKGTVSTIPGVPAVPIKVSSSEALSDTEASFMLLFDVKKQQHLK